jgi:hypothetical protein
MNDEGGLAQRPCALDGAAPTGSVHDEEFLWRWVREAQRRFAVQRRRDRRR